MEEKSADTTSTWEFEKRRIALLQSLKEQLDSARQELEIASRNGDLAKAGELTYSKIPDLDRKLAEMEKEVSGELLKKEVTSEDIAGIVSRWTGIPVERMIGSEQENYYT